MAVLTREASLRCTDCGQAESTWTELCPGCQAPGTLHSIYTSQWRSVPELIDIVREAAGGREHHRALLERASSGDDRAATKLADLGESAVADIFDGLARVKRPEAALEVLISMGLPAYPEMLDAHVRMRDLTSRGIARRRIRGVGTHDDALVHISCALGPGVIPVLAERLERYESALADVAARVFLRLGAGDALDAHRHRFEPRLVLRALRELDTATFVRLLASLQTDSFLLEEVLTDPAWKGDGALAEALRDPALFDRVVAVLRRRGLTDRFVRQSRHLLLDETTVGLLVDLLAELPLEACRLYLPYLTDPGIPAPSRRRLGEHLQTALAGQPQLLVEQLGQGDRRAEGELRRAIAACGAVGLRALERAYHARLGRVLGSLRPLARNRDRQARHALALALVTCVEEGVADARDLANRLLPLEQDPDTYRLLERAAGEDA
jgi:hypothetical protein